MNDERPATKPATPSPKGAVFLSYAREDIDAARQIAEALQAAGIEAWFDREELRGGDVWDQKIRRQIRECALFVPIISDNTQARLEGYFRLEWKLAAQRTHTMATAKPFVVPVVIDATDDAELHVPDEFRVVQWTHLPGGAATADFCARMKALLSESAKGGTRAFLPRDQSREPYLRPAAEQRPRRPWVFAAGAAIVLALAFGFASAWQKKGPSATVLTAPEPDKNSIAVLAFKNLSPQPENEYVSEGISDELINLLGRVRGLRVIGRTSAFAFKQKNATAQEIGRTLGVVHLVEGSVQRVGSHTRIHASLIRAQTGEQIWSDSFDFEPKDVFTAQEEIAGKITKSLSLTLGASGRAARTVNPAAHALVLEGRHFFVNRSYEGFIRSEKAFTGALELDPQFAEAHAGLALVWITRAGYSETDGVGNAAAEADRGEAEAHRAIELDPNLPEGHLALGYASLWRGKFADAEQRLRQAMTLNPNSADVRHFLGLVYSCTGHLDRAIAEHKQAAMLEPLGWMNLQNLARVLYWARRYSEALAINERAAALRGSDVFVPNRGEQARLALQLGRRDEAIAAAKWLRDNPNLYPRWQLDSAAIRVLWRLGEQAQALGYAEELFKKFPPEHYQRGFVLGAMDRFEEALPYLEHTPAQPVRYLYWDESWDKWRDDPRFQRLMEKLGRTEEYNTARASIARLLQEQPAEPPEPETRHTPIAAGGK